MTAPRLVMDLNKIRHNAYTLVNRLAYRGITVSGITKAGLGSPEIADAMLRAGVSSLGDSRIENIEAMRGAGVQAPIALIRSPMFSQADQVIGHADMSFNTELEVINKLSCAAVKAGRIHEIVLMIELGDLREGIMPGDLEETVRKMLPLPNIVLNGIGTNLACRSGVSPNHRNMAELSALADSVESRFGLTLDIVSGGNSANLDWALGSSRIGRINHLRLGESILLGREPLHRKPIDGLYTDAFTLVTEVIESKIKPSKPMGKLAQSAFGDMPAPANRGSIAQSILAIGRQDVDPSGLQPPPHIRILGASSDHLIVEHDSGKLPIGAEVSFQLNYSALVCAMTSPFVTKVKIPVSAISEEGQTIPRERDSESEVMLPRAVAIGKHPLR